MSAKKPVRLFITHAYQEHEEYARVFEYLESRDNFYYVNCSNPENKPEGGAKDAVQEHLRQQIRSAEVVVYPVALHAQDPGLITFQLHVAQAFKIPILAIKPFGETVQVPVKLLEPASEVVDWNDRVITDTLKRLAHGGGSGDTDIIEFDIEGLDIPELPK